MRSLTRSRPSPAIVVAILALVAGLAGTAVAGPDATTSAKAVTKAKVKQISKKTVNKLAPGLSVANAQNAQNATNAQNAQNAQNANSANNANAPFAYARFNADGVVTPPEQSRNISSANISNPLPGVYCLDLPFNPVTGQATSQAQSNADDIAMIEIATGGVALDQCPNTAEVELNNYDVSTGAQANETMYVQLGI
jgi:hypothetical protein